MTERGGGICPSAWPTSQQGLGLGKNNLSDYPVTGLVVSTKQSPPCLCPLSHWAPPGTGSSSQNPFPLAGGSPRTLLREASLLCSLGWLPGLGARRVVRQLCGAPPSPRQGFLEGVLVPVRPGPCRLTARQRQPSAPWEPSVLGEC